MDKYKEYIPMCEKAKEIHNLWEPKNGDIVIVKGASHHFVINPNPFDVNLGEDKKRFIWLPRQEDLQNMLFGDIDGDRKTKYWWMGDKGNLDRFQEIVDINWCDYFWGLSDPYPSLEQLWLAYVMFELYDKIWDGNDWIKQSDKIDERVCKSKHDLLLLAQGINKHEST